MAHVRLPDGTTIQARGIEDPTSIERDTTPTFGLYLDRRWHDRDISWRHEFVAWPDFGIPTDEAAAFASMVRAWELAASGETVEVACHGGIGRTGTVVACLAILSGVAPLDAVSWTRVQYHPQAVETASQEEMIARFARWASATGRGRQV